MLPCDWLSTTASPCQSDSASSRLAKYIGPQICPRRLAPFVGDPDRQIARAQLGLLKGQLDDLILDSEWDTVPYPAWCRWPIGQPLRPAVTVAMIPAVKGPARDAELIQRALG